MPTNDLALTVPPETAIGQRPGVSATPVAIRLTPSITPIAYHQELFPTPVPISTSVPAARGIPRPARIPTVEIVKEFVTSPNPAILELTNAWISRITINIEGFKIVVDPGSTETRELPPGEYAYTASAPDCGRSTDRFTLKANTHYSFEFTCRESGLFGEAPSDNRAILEIVNDLGVTITFAINGLRYQVPPGRLEIKLPPGTYTYTASAPGFNPTDPETITLSLGVRRTITFSRTPGL